MADFDLSTQSGRADARAAGNWVGEDSSGKIVMEPGHPSGQAGTPSGGGTPAPAPGAPTGANLAAGTLLLQQAQQAAYQAYLNAKLNLDTDQNAWQKAAQEASTLIAQAGVTGTFNGMPTQAAIKQAADLAAQQSATMLSYATQFGVWGMPQTGAQTLASQKQTFDMANQAAQTTGWYTPYSYTPPTAGAFPQGMGTPTAGAAGAPQAPAVTNKSGLPVGSFVKDANGQGVGKVQPDGSILGFRNPQEYQAAGGDPNWGGITPIPTAQWQQFTTLTPYTPPAAPAAAAGAAGQQPAAGAAAGQTIPQAGATLGTPPGWQAGQPVQTLARWQAEQDASQKYLTLLSSLRGPADWAQYQKVLGATPQGTQDLVRAAAGQYIPGGGATTGVQPQAANLNTLYNQATGGNQAGQSDLTQLQNTLVAPNQMAPQTWNALQPSQQQMLLGVWESQGYSKDDAQNLFKQSLPKYAMPTGSGNSGTFRLQ